MIQRWDIEEGGVYRMLYPHTGPHIYVYVYKIDGDEAITHWFRLFDSVNIYKLNKQPVNYSLHNIMTKCADDVDLHTRKLIKMMLL